MQIEHSYRDPDRLCPVPAGPALLDGKRLTVRLAQGDASIAAPRALLNRVVGACDGTRTLSQIVADTRPASLRAKVSGLIDDLLAHGVLIDASLFTVAAQRFAWIPSPFGTAAEKSVWRQVPLRFSLADEARLGPQTQAGATAIDALLEQRRSVRTYDDTRSLDEAALRSYLWLLAGVVHVAPPGHGSGPRRTIPSGGAVHALRPLLVLQRPVGTLPPGVYAISYPATRHVQLDRVHEDTGWLPRAVLHPWYLTYSTGMVFLVADPRLGAIKYRARALQYLFMEAGAAMQNAALAAPSLDIAMSVYGGYVEAASGVGLHLGGHDIVIASAVFGTAPTAAQEQQAARAWHLDFAWVDAPSASYTTPFHVARCRLEAAGGTQIETWGRDRNPWLAYLKATVESVERLGFRSPRHVAIGRLRDWDAALDPREVIRYADVQYRGKSFPLKPFDERARAGWVPGRALGSGRRMRVLAELVYSSRSLQEQMPGALAGYTEANSSGCAAHLDEARAVDAALLELIERDAFMRAWLAQQPGSGVSAGSLPAALRRRIATLEALGCTVSMQHLPSPWAPVCAVYAQHEARHFTVVGAAARTLLAEAAEAALDEMETLAYVNFNEPDGPRPKPRDVKAPIQHTLLYASANHFRRADALLQPARMTTLAKAARGCDFNGPVAPRLLAAGREVIVVDIAAPGSRIDQGRTPVSVVRALVPGLVPMSFGHNREPLGSVDRFDPRARFPHPFP
jgi:ribosomal protein S12 methylthiotransferase accessory factor